MSANGPARRPPTPAGLARLLIAGWRIVLPAACLLACGCQGPSCTPAPLAVLRLLDEPTGSYVSVAIDGRPVKLLLDTGSAQSLLTSETARRLGLRVERLLDDSDVLIGFAIEGVGGRRHIDRAWTHKLELGSAPLLGVAFPVVWSVNTAWDRSEDGILGMDILSRYDLDLDVGHGRLALYEPGRQCPPPPHAHATTMMLLHDVGTSGPRLAVRIDGHDFSGLIDTGTQRSSLMAPAAAQLPAAGKPDGRRFAVYGVGTSRGTGFLREFGAVSIGSVTLSDWRLAVVTAAGLSGLDVIVGTDVLRHLHLWLSGSRHSLSVAESSGDVEF